MLLYIHYFRLTMLYLQTCQKHIVTMTSSLLHYAQFEPERYRSRVWQPRERRVDLALLTACWITRARVQSALWERVAYRFALRCRRNPLLLPFHRLECSQDDGPACNWQQIERPAALQAETWFGPKTFQSCLGWKQHRNSVCQYKWQLFALSIPKCLAVFVAECICLPWKQLLEGKWLCEAARGWVRTGLAWQDPYQICPE